MSQQITEAFVQEFAANFLHVAQQQTSRFEGAVMVESGIVGTSKSINRLGQRAAQRRLNRHSDTPLNDQPHSTRFVDLFDWEDGDMIDDQDKIRMLADPNSDYVKAMVASLNRAKDDVLIGAWGGNARATSGNIALTAGQKVAVGGTGLTRAKVVAARVLFRRNEADEENGEELFLGIHATGLSDLLSDTSLTNSEYNTVLSMQSGAIKEGKLFGFTCIPSERFIKTGATRMVYAWAKSGTTLGIGADIVSKVGEDPGKAFNVRVYAKMSLGAVRVEEEKVVEIACNDP
jgi:hypothetical protein